MNGKKSIEELKDLITFLQGLWGILAGISVFFPLSGEKVFYVGMWAEGKGGFGRFPPDLVIAVTTLFTLFIVLWTFGQRHNYKFNTLDEKRLIQRHAWNSFAIGISALFIYLIATFAILGNIYYVFNIESGSLLWILGDAFLLIIYISFFAMMTRAFMLLGMIEFFEKKG